MPNLTVEYNKEVESCKKCGESYYGDKGWVYNQKTVVAEDHGQWWESKCPHCGTFNKIPLKIVSRATSMLPSLPKPINRKLGQSNKSAGRDMWSSHDIPRDLKQKLEEEKRLRNAKEEEE